MYVGLIPFQEGDSNVRTVTSAMRLTTACQDTSVSTQELTRRRALRVSDFSSGQITSRRTLRTAARSR